LITIVGYTAATALTALSPGLLWLTVAQFGAQVFLGAEWAVAITIVVEEFPREHRGKTLGIVASMNTLGGIFVGILAFIGLQDTALGWRAFFLVGLIPLALIAWAGARCSRPSGTKRSAPTNAASTSTTPRSWSPGSRPIARPCSRSVS
jgi:MFS family permease